MLCKIAFHMGKRKWDSIAHHRATLQEPSSRPWGGEGHTGLGKEENPPRVNHGNCLSAPMMHHPSCCLQANARTSHHERLFHKHSWWEVPLPRTQIARWVMHHGLNPTHSFHGSPLGGLGKKSYTQKSTVGLVPPCLQHGGGMVSVSLVQD